MTLLPHCCRPCIRCDTAWGLLSCRTMSRRPGCRSRHRIVHHPRRIGRLANYTPPTSVGILRAATPRLDRGVRGFSAHLLSPRCSPDCAVQSNNRLHRATEEGLRWIDGGRGMEREGYICGDNRLCCNSASPAPGLSATKIRASLAALNSVKGMLIVQASRAGKAHQNCNVPEPPCTEM